MTILSAFLLNLFLNTLLMFFTVILLIEAFFILFRIHSQKIKVYLRVLPFIKLPLDLFLYDYSNWVVMNNINPILQKLGTRYLEAKQGLTSSIGFSVFKQYSFTPADILFYEMGNSIFYFSLPFLFLLILIPMLRGYYFLQSKNQLKKQINKLPISSYEIRNMELSDQIKKRKILIKQTEKNITPFTNGFTIVLPKVLMGTLSNDQIEAIIAHELGHIVKKDLFINTFLFIICSIFWWIPTQFFRKKIEIAQDFISDKNTKKYGIAPVDLMYALMTSLKSTYPLNHRAINSFHAKDNLKRFQLLLDRPEKKQFITNTILILFCLSLLLGKIWIF